MGLLTTILGSRKQAATRDAGDDFWYSPVPRARVMSGATVTVQTALTLPVVLGCLKVLAETVAELPLHLYEQKSDGSKSKAERHPLYDVLYRQPNAETTAYEYWGQLVCDLASFGNHYSEIVPGLRGPVDQLVRVSPECVTVSRLSDGSRRYEIKIAGQPIRQLLDGEVWHLKLLPLTADGLMGVSPMWLGRESIGAALALQEYGARFFANDATPPFIIKHPGNFKDDQSKANFLAALKRWWGGSNRGSPGVLEYGMEAMKLGASNEEAQFLETRKEHNLDICRIWRVPPHKVGILDRATFSNIEHQSLEFVTDTILPWLRLIEQAISRDLLMQPERFYAQFNVDGLLRGDLESRYRAYAVGRNWGWLSVNDVRRRENMDPVADGDTYLQPLNMVPAGQELPTESRPKPQQSSLAPGSRGPELIGGRVHAPSL